MASDETDGGTAAAASRRNGKAASCEPCRKRKIRCGHERPICARCSLRRLEKKCYYHPAPLTKPRESLLISPNPMELSMVAETNDNNDNPSISNRRASLTTSPGSHVSGRSKPALANGAHGTDHAQASRLQTIQMLLGQLQRIQFIKRSLEDYYSSSAAALVPGALVLPAVTDLHERWNRSSDPDALCRSLAGKVMQATEATIDVTQMTNASDFCNVHHGPNLRLEILGLIFALAGRSTMYYAGKGRSPFVLDMLRYSNDALELARQMVPEATDALLWLQYENYLLTNSLNDDRGFSSWRRLSELINELFALSVHRESSLTSVPFFLAEIRRRAFVIAFHSDKLMAGQDDRPPGISRRHSDCRMPLDLTDQELLTSDPEELIRYQQNLTNEGWSIDEKYSSSTWARLRFQVAVLREEVLEYHFQLSTPENMDKLRNISERNRAFMEALPIHLRYSPERWDSGLADTLCYMLTATYLSHCQLDFQVFRLLEKNDPEALSSLLRVSEEIVATVLRVGNLRSRASFLAHDFKFLILAYGLPSAAVLAAALENTAGSAGARLPNDISRSGLIRSLSVFVPMLESLEQLPELRKLRSMESAKLISRAIDKALEGPGSTEPGSGPPTAPYQPEFSSVGFVPAPGSLMSSNFDPTLTSNDGMDLMDLSNWANNIDWSNIGNDWMTF